MAPLADCIRRWSEDRDKSNVQRYRNEVVKRDAWGEDNWVADLARLSGISTRRIRAILAGVSNDGRSGPVHHVSFRTADALITAMDMAPEWHTNPDLKPHYGPLNVQRWEAHYEQPLPEAEYAEELEDVA